MQRRDDIKGREMENDKVDQGRVGEMMEEREKGKKKVQGKKTKVHA